MKAVGYLKSLPIEEKDSLMDLELPKPVISEPFDLLVQIKAISVNPVDFKIRQSSPSQNERPKILGWDASGVVVSAGSHVRQFKEGDEVFYSGDLKRPGTAAEYHLVDARLVDHKPKILTSNKQPPCR